MPDRGYTDAVKIIIKLSREKHFLLTNGEFTAFREDDAAGINDLLSQEPKRRIYPLFGSSSESNLGVSARDEDLELGQYYVIEIHDIRRAEELARALNTMRPVEEAYVEPPTNLAI